MRFITFIFVFRHCGVKIDFVGLKLCCGVRNRQREIKGITSQIRHLVRMSICPRYVHLYFRFQMISGVNVSGFSTILVCTLILWRCGLQMLMDKFCQFLTKLCLICPNFHFWMLSLVNVNRFSQNLVCA